LMLEAQRAAARAACRPASRGLNVGARQGGERARWEGLLELGVHSLSKAPSGKVPPSGKESIIMDNGG
jgi:hypothetical protein